MGTLAGCFRKLAGFHAAVGGLLEVAGDRFEVASFEVYKEGGVVSIAPTCRTSSREITLDSAT